MKSVDDPKVTRLVDIFDAMRKWLAKEEEKDKRIQFFYRLKPLQIGVLWDGRPMANITAVDDSITIARVTEQPTKNSVPIHVTTIKPLDNGRFQLGNEVLTTEALRLRLFSILLGS